MTMDAVERVERSISAARIREFLESADYYIAGLQAVQRKQRVTDLDERWVAYDIRREAILDRLPSPPDTGEG